MPLTGLGRKISIDNQVFAIKIVTAQIQTNRIISYSPPIIITEIKSSTGVVNNESLIIHLYFVVILILDK
ncbi:hypothetical protein A4D02_27580 [Niastella koreensis]|uniref:Uncharacterized protein n=1 Tax=Niastella koreensis TaxID=354356 RepID=A0ABX3NZ64_9BACT|nr:hypothetical protein A4D02_27580 [Niastella koreensis]